MERIARLPDDSLDGGQRFHQRLVIGVRLTAGVKELTVDHVNQGQQVGSLRELADERPVILQPLAIALQPRQADAGAGRLALDSIMLIVKEFGVNINLSASNGSSDLPDPHTVNQAFLALGRGCVPAA